MAVGTGASTVPVELPTMASPVTCCHNETVSSSHITRSELRNRPETPKRST